DNDINIVRVNDIQRLAEIVGNAADNEEPRDMHCILVTNPSQDSWKDPALEKLGVFCEESRCTNQWVPNISFPER
ncbi:hypothetical protein KFY57_27660, partial [Salmonella enterica subsp. enterica serovar Typhimurium]|nr:hypothetical protein [Salmonella enterica subsp. enterica serovar Typhimurium]